MHARSLLFASMLVPFVGLAGSAFAQTTDGGPLLQPGEAYPGTQQEPIRLHLPEHHKAEQTSATKPASGEAPRNSSEASAETPPAVAEQSSETRSAPRLHRPKHPAAAPEVANTALPATNAQETTIPFSLDSSGALPEAPAPAAPAKTTPAPAKTASAPAKTASAPPFRAPIATNPHVAPQPVVRQASLNPSTTASSGDHDNLTKRGAILFEKGAPAPSAVQYKGLKELAGALSAALETGASRIQLEAYGGTPGDKSSDARRLSLRRALAVRQLLIDDGVPSARIDVRAMGGVDDKGPPDRVDVFIRAG